MSMHTCPICGSKLRLDTRGIKGDAHPGTTRHFALHMCGHGVLKVSLWDASGGPLVFRCWCGFEGNGTEIATHYDTEDPRHLTLGYARARLDAVAERFDTGSSGATARPPA